MVSRFIRAIIPCRLMMPLDVTFNKVGNDANHLRTMIDPKARGFAENKLCGWAAKVEPDERRSELVPIYRGDDGAFMDIGGYVCYRRYYCTCADPPSNTFKDRQQKPPPMFTCPHPKQRDHLGQHRAAEDAPDAPNGGEPQQPLDVTSGSNVQTTADADADEAPVDITTGGQDEDPDKETAAEEAPLQEPDVPDATSSADPDHYDGENIDNRLYEANEH